MDEENQPLLLVYIDKNGKKSDFPQRVIVADKSRGNGVAKGAATFISRWPVHLMTYWLYSIILILLFVFLVIMPLKFVIVIDNNGHPRCVRDINSNNRTVHLTHDGFNWTNKQLEFLNDIAETYSKYEIHVLIFVNDYYKIYDREEHKNDMIMNEIGFGNRILRALSRNFEEVKTTFKDVAMRHDNVKPDVTSYERYFSRTALCNEWKRMKTNERLFAARTNELWQFGGISFFLPMNDEQKYYTERERRTIVEVKRRYERSSDGDAVFLDSRGAFMSSRIPCHAFYGEMITMLASRRDNVSVPLLITDAITLFCKRDTNCSLNLNF